MHYKTIQAICPTCCFELHAFDSAMEREKDCMYVSVYRSLSEQFIFHSRKAAAEWNFIHHSTKDIRALA